MKPVLDLIVLQDFKSKPSSDGHIRPFIASLLMRTKDINASPTQDESMKEDSNILCTKRDYALPRDDVLHA